MSKNYGFSWNYDILNIITDEGDKSKWEENPMLIVLYSFYCKCAMNKIKYYISYARVDHFLIRAIIDPQDLSRIRVLNNSELPLADRDLLI